MYKGTGNTTSNSIAVTNHYRFISKKISALLLALICALTLAACGSGSGDGEQEGGEQRGDEQEGERRPVEDNNMLDPVSVSNLRVTLDDTNATLSWDNPAANITSISINYKITDSNDSPTTLPITESAKIAANAQDVQETITELTNEGYYTFTVALTLDGDDAGREGTAPSVEVPAGPDDDGDGLPNFIDPDLNGDGLLDRDSDNDGIFNYLDNDDDNDTIPDAADVDDDGDGLIEIATAEQFNQIRHNLLGSNFTLSPAGMGNASGCGNGTIDGEDITTCDGYELSADISLADYANWQPIGSCPTFNSRGICADEDALFNAVFDGNGWTISNLTITNSTGTYANATGLFGAISPTSILHNINIRAANLNGGGNNVGLLVGYAQGASISDSSAEGEVNASGYDVGGLVGDGKDSIITSSYVAGMSVIGYGNVGGLVGSGHAARIMSSYAEVEDINGISQLGGLVGDGDKAVITSSYASGNSVNGTFDVGGLVGSGVRIIVASSYASVASVSGLSEEIGGLVGEGLAARITSSYAVGSVNGNSEVGGLVGDISNLIATFSYWDSTASGITTTTGLDGSPKTTEELQMPIDFVGSIYAKWEDDLCGDEHSFAWDLGNSTQYPALHCTPGGLDVQRP